MIFPLAFRFGLLLIFPISNTYAYNTQYMNSTLLSTSLQGMSTKNSDIFHDEHATDHKKQAPSAQPSLKQKRVHPEVNPNPRSAQNRLLPRLNIFIMRAS